MVKPASTVGDETEDGEYFATVYPPFYIQYILNRDYFGGRRKFLPYANFPDLVELLRSSFEITESLVPRWRKNYALSGLNLNLQAQD